MPAPVPVYFGEKTKNQRIVLEKCSLTSWPFLHDHVSFGIPWLIDTEDDHGQT